MFPLIDRNMPHVEEQILSYLGAGDLIAASSVSKSWRTAAQRHVDRLATSNKATVSEDTFVLLLLFKKTALRQVQLQSIFLA